MAWRKSFVFLAVIIAGILMLSSLSSLKIIGKRWYPSSSKVRNKIGKARTIFNSCNQRSILSRASSTASTAGSDRIPKKVVFMGTPDFATPALSKLIESHHEVVAVYSQPPRPAGRGRKLQKSPVQKLAEEHGIPVYTPVSLRKKDAQEEFANLNADVATVTAYGLLLPKPILEAFKYGCLNIHPSLLPRWRGAAPIQWTLIEGDRETGVCIMQLDEGMDTGPIHEVKKIAVPEGATAGEMHDELANMGADMLVDLVDRVHISVPEVQTPESAATHARKIKKEDGKLDFSQSAEKLVNLVHGISPVPGAFLELQGKPCKILRAEVVDGDTGGAAPGTVIDDKFSVVCGDGTLLRPTTLQKPGKRPTDLNSFLNGNKIEKGTSVSNAVPSS
mmetsp:Transcript_13181/g.19690  ORF Transcript_13181/g.19690 Transcript_13181/m.19690 type:complete len:390 (+) Transcript_13181:57-1226(+)